MQQNKLFSVKLISIYQKTMADKLKKGQEPELEQGDRTLLARIRENMPLVVVIIAIALLGFVLTDFISGYNRSGARTATSVGSIAGENVDAKDFATKYQQRLDLIQQQGQNLTDADRFQVMDMIWNQMVSDKAFEQQYKSLGLTVTPEEVREMFTGKNVSPVVKQYFNGFFQQQGKEFNAADVEKYLSQAVNDPNEKVRLKEFETYLIQSRMKEKFEAMVSAGYLSSKAQAARKHLESQKKVNISFMGVNYSQIPDSTLKATDAELLAYMSKNAAKYKAEDQTVLKYVQYDLRPTAADSQKALTEVVKYKERFAAAKDDSTFVYGKSRKKYDKNGYVPLNNVPAVVKDSVKVAVKGAIIGPVLDNDAYKLFKVVDARKGGATNAKVSHIVIRPKATTAADSAAALAEATAIKASATAANFAQLVMQKSQDMATKQNGGSIGWYNAGDAAKPGMYGVEFDNAVKATAKGGIVGPIKTPQGYHIIYVEDKTDESYLIAEVEKEIRVSQATNTAVFGAVNDFAAKAQAAKDIEVAGKAANMIVRTSNPLENNTKMLSGVPARELILWAIDAKQGEFSKVFNVAEGFIFAQVSKKSKAGLKSLDDVKAEVTHEVLAEKKAKMITDKLNPLQGKNLEEMKTGYGAGAFVSTANDISFESPSIPGIGNDPYLIGKVTGMAKGTTSKPIVGKNGVYVVQVTEVVEAPKADEAALLASRKSAAQQGQGQLKSKVEPALVKMADAKDERHKAGY